MKTLALSIFVVIATYAIPCVHAQIHFAPPVTYPFIQSEEGCPVRDMATGDLNHDGDIDIVILTGSYGKLGFECSGFSGFSVLMGIGDGTFAPPVKYNTQSYPQYILLEDMNNDSILDIVFSTSGGSIAILPGNGDGTFAPALQKIFPHQGFTTGIATADLNKDGNMDIVAAICDFNWDAYSQCGFIFALYGEGDGTISSYCTLNYTQYDSCSGSLVIADIDNDGHLDIIGIALTNLLPEDYELFVGYGDTSDCRIARSEVLLRNIHYQNYYKDIHVVDLDNDLYPEIVITGYGGVVILQGESFTPIEIHHAGFHPIAFTLTDLNLDGYQDIIMSGYNSTSSEGMVSVLPGGPNISFGDPILFPIGNRPEFIATADFNNDGLTDIVISTDTNEVTILLAEISNTSNDGGGTQTIHQAPVKVYPNPATGFLTLHADSDILAIKMYTLTGREVRNMYGPQASLHQVDLSDLASGLYLLNVVTANGTYAVKAIVEN